MEMLRRYALAAFVTLGIMGCTIAASAQDEPVAKAAFDAAYAALAPHTTGFGIDDEPQAPGLLRQEWLAIGQEAVAYLNDHPAASEAELAAALATSSLTIEAIRLDQQSFLIALGQGEMGTALIIAKRSERFALVWTLWDFAGSGRRKFGMLAAWSADKARENCRERLPDARWAECGPIFPTKIGRLPDRRDGSPRFFIDATYAQAAGSTVGAQISLWTWTGMTAKPLYAQSYGWEIDQAVGTRLEGDILRIRVKEYYKILPSCGSCEGRQRDWSLRITPDRIEDLGKTSVVPELDLIDTLYDRLSRHRPVSDMASPSVVKALAPKIGDTGEDVGFAMAWKVTEDGPYRMVCVSTVAVGTYLFTIDTRRARPRIISAKPLQDSGCEK